MEDIRIVVLDRGWVFAGEYANDGKQITITKAQNIRRWGTSRGLGELRGGPLEDTKLDPYGTIIAAVGAEKFSLRVDAEGWRGVLA